MSGPDVNVYCNTTMNSYPGSVPTESMYTEVNEQSDRFLLANQGKKIQGSQQKIFPPLPPIPPILVLPTNTSKQTRQIGRSTSLHCMLDDTRNHEYKIPSVSDEPHYDDVMIAKAQSINPNVSLSNGDEYQLMQKTDGTTDLEGMVNLLTSKYTEVHGELKKSQQSLTELQRVISDIKESISSIQLQIASFSSQSERGREKIDSEAATNFLESQKNRTRLSRMNTEEVLHLLTVLGLSQYKKRFQKERINGRFLLECDEDILKHNLGVSNKLHRLRLMMYITGKQCAHSTLDQQERE